LQSHSLNLRDCASIIAKELNCYKKGTQKVGSPQMRNSSDVSLPKRAASGKAGRAPDEPKRLTGVPRRIGPYQMRAAIGDGSFSVVRQVYLPPPADQFFACKIVERKLLSQGDLERRFESEIRIHQQLRHPGIVALVDILKDDNFFYIILEYCPGGELFERIVKDGPFPEAIAKTRIAQVLETVQYLHDHNVVHRDLKPENLLLDKTGRPKLSDFGLSKFVHQNFLVSTPCGSPCYASPECLAGEPYDAAKSDCWSLGVITYAMLTGQLPWTKTNHNQLFEQIKKGEYRIPPNFSAPCRDFLARLLTVDPESRMSAAEALNHPFLKDRILDINGSETDLPVSAVSLKKVDNFFNRELLLEDVIVSHLSNSFSSGRFDSTFRCICPWRKAVVKKAGSDNGSQLSSSKIRSAILKGDHPLSDDAS
jgi:serine/threonine protein kinase